MGLAMRDPESVRLTQSICPNWNGQDRFENISATPMQNIPLRPHKGGGVSNPGVVLRSEGQGYGGDRSGDRGVGGDGLWGGEGGLLSGPGCPLGI